MNTNTKKGSSATNVARLTLEDALAGVPFYHDNSHWENRRVEAATRAHSTSGDVNTSDAQESKLGFIDDDVNTSDAQESKLGFIDDDVNTGHDDGSESRLDNDTARRIRLDCLIKETRMLQQLVHHSAKLVTDAKSNLEINAALLEERLNRYKDVKEAMEAAARAD